MQNMTVNISVFELQNVFVQFRVTSPFAFQNGQDNHFFSNPIHQFDAKLSDEQLPTIFIVKNAPQMEI
jgi:hypothetical protein